MLCPEHGNSVGCCVWSIKGVWGVVSGTLKECGGVVSGSFWDCGGVVSGVVAASLLL